ncbi:MAG: hypothetical protein WCI41_01970 [bacterium]
MGPISFIAILAIAIIYFFNFKVFLFCVLLSLAGAVFAVIRVFMLASGWWGIIKRFLKKIWKKYLIQEKKFFDWLDSL